MKTLVNIVVASILLLVGFVAGTGFATAPTKEAPAKTASAKPVTSALNKEDIKRLINDERAGQGLLALKSNDDLDEAACYKAHDMIASDYWGHVSPAGVDPWYWFGKAGYVYRSGGENLAYGFTSNESAVIGWMNSPGHRANIVGNYLEQGVCLVTGEFMGHEETVIVSLFGTQDE